MNVDKKLKYIEFCKKEPIPIFSQYWWLDTVCGKDNWDVLLYEKGGKIWASFPYCIKKKYGFTLITMPKLTQTLGPYIKYPEEQKYYRRLSWEKEIMNYFIEHLPKFDYFNINFHYSITNWLPFYWKDFKQTTRYTYIIDTKQFNSLDHLYNILTNKVKNNIKKEVKKGISIVYNIPIKIFYSLVLDTFKKQGLRIPYSFLFLEKLINVVLSKNQGLLVGAKNPQGEIVGAVFAAFDSSSLYIIASGYKSKQGSTYFLRWELLKLAFKKKLIFDFAGSMLERIEQRNRSFGAIQKPYFNIFKINSKILKFIYCLKRF